MANHDDASQPADKNSGNRQASDVPGTVKEPAAAPSTKLEGEGKTDQVKGKAQKAVGNEVQ